MTLLKMKLIPSDLLRKIATFLIMTCYKLHVHTVNEAFHQIQLLKHVHVQLYTTCYSKSSISVFNCKQATQQSAMLVGLLVGCCQLFRHFFLGNFGIAAPAQMHALAFILPVGVEIWHSSRLLWFGRWSGRSHDVVELFPSRVEVRRPPEVDQSNRRSFTRLIFHLGRPRELSPRPADRALSLCF